MQRILIWDIPTRLFHWMLALSFLGTWLTTESDRWLSVHVFLGYLMLGLVGFRVIWGWLGTHYARFASFWFSPREALSYLRRVLDGTAARHIGHNPTGSVAIYLLLLLTLVMGLTGFLTLGGEEQQGLLSGAMSLVQSRTFKKLHELVAWLMLLLVIGHFAGVVLESVLHRENLARSMLTGTKLAPPGAPVAQPRRLVAVLMLVLMTGAGGWWFYYAIDASLDQQVGRHESGIEEPQVKFVGAKLADNAKWRDECGSCHMAFHPNLLPSRSWQRVMREQERHFGADLALDAPTQALILNFLSSNSADRQGTEASFKIAGSIKPGAVPLRITETPYWIRKHRNISAAQWQSAPIKSQANCAACHQDAEQGTFLDAAIQLPVAPPAGAAAFKANP